MRCALGDLFCRIWVNLEKMGTIRVLKPSGSEGAAATVKVVTNAPPSIASDDGAAHFHYQLSVLEQRRIERL